MKQWRPSAKYELKKSTQCNNLIAECGWWWDNLNQVTFPTTLGEHLPATDWQPQSSTNHFKPQCERMTGDVLQFCSKVPIHASCGLTGWAAWGLVSASAMVPKLTGDNVYAVKCLVQSPEHGHDYGISLFLVTFRESTGSVDDTITHLPS